MPAHGDFCTFDLPTWALIGYMCVAHVEQRAMTDADLSQQRNLAF